MAPEHTSRPTRPPAWPENPPAWPEMPPPPPPQRPDTAVAEPLPYGGSGAASYASPASGPGTRPPRPAGPLGNPAGPQGYSPGQEGPRGYTPQGTGPQGYTSQGTGPQGYTPHPTGPRGYTPQGTGPQHPPSHDAGPHTRSLPHEPGAARHLASQAHPMAPQRHSGSYTPPGTETTMRVSGPPMPQGQPGTAAQAPAHQPEDPYRPFVTAGQISGPKTPPPERQQELWDTVFGDNYEALGENGDDDEGGSRAWLIALVASAVVALVAALLWAFLAGPLSSASGPADAATKPSNSRSTPKEPAPGKPVTKPLSVGKLPKYPGQASPRAGILTDTASAITLARLGGPWRLDRRTEHVRSTYGFTTRQYVAAGNDAAGAPKFAHVMTGPPAKGLAGKYSTAQPANLAPVINAVAASARGKFFPKGSKAVKTAEQRLSAGGRPARLVAYQVTADGAKTTMVVAAVSTGADLPAIVYMSVPAGKKDLLPDINTIFSSIRPSSAAS